MKDVDEYIASAPKGAQTKLRELRTAIRAAAPNAEESLSYGMPFYSYRGEVGVGARLCYFGLKTDGIGFYLRPKDFSNHLDKVAKFQRTKSALRFELAESIPVTLVRALVKDAVKRHVAEENT